MNEFASTGPSPRAILERMARFGSERGLAVVIDDAHHLDRHSAALVLQAAVARVAGIVVTVRDGESPPDAVTALWKDGIAERVELAPMDRPTSNRMIEAALGGPVADSVSHRIFALARGNPLYTRLFVEGSLHEGTLQSVEGVWRLRDGAGAPDELLQLVRSRVRVDDRTVVEVVEHLAVCEPLDLDIVHDLVGRDGVESAERMGLVRVMEHEIMPVVIFAHPLYGEVVRRDAAQSALRRVRANLVGALARRGEAETLRRGILHLGADMPRDPDLLCHAAHRAKNAFDLGLTLRLADAAIAGGGGREARLLRATTLSFLGRDADSEREFAELTFEGLDDLTRAAIMIARSGTMLFPGQDPGGARRLLDLAEPDAGEGAPAIAAMRLLVDVFSAPVIPSAEDIRAIVDVGTGSAAGDYMAMWAWLAACGPRGLVNPQDALLARAYAMSEASDLSNTRFGFADTHLLGLRLAGYGPEILALSEQRQAEVEGVPDPTGAHGVYLRGAAAFYRGRLDIAIRSLREARAGMEPLRRLGLVTRCMQSLTQALGMRGEAGEAAEALAETKALSHPSLAWSVPEELLADAWTRAATGDRRAAVAAASKAATAAGERGATGHEALALQVAARFGDVAAAERLVEVTGSISSPGPRRWRMYAVALTHADAEGLVRASRQEELEGDLVAAADMAAQAAECWRRNGAAARAQLHAERATRLAAAAGGARTPVLATARVEVVLSPREREIADLVTRGLANRAIAEQLGVSARTVEGHVYRLMGKLGVERRTEIREVFESG
ncbi:MAG: helix-turn-helix transcriptional regulator [Micropruina sp.]